MKYTFITGLLLLSLASCHSSQGTDAAAPADTMATMKDTTKTYDVALLDNKKDPVCGMPSAAGMQDTIHLNGKVIGFCSKECKNNFLKNPKQYAVEYK